MLIPRSWCGPVLIAALALPLASSASPRKDTRPVRAAGISEVGNAQFNFLDENMQTEPAFGATVTDGLPEIAAAGCKDRQCLALRFDAASPVPEPDTYTLLLVGLGMVVFAARRAVSVGANRTVSSSERHGGAKLPFSN
ncbi:MAG TPA: PEP-CTERM sorting domain-containing protein [Telluria sp.]|jgi:hypothetical protein